VETPSGILSDTDLQGAGLQGFLATELPWLAQRQVRTVVSIAGQNLGEWAELARRVGMSPGVAAVEVNLAWPPGAVAARDSYQAGKILAAVRRDMPRGIPVLAKVAPDVHHVVDVARAVVKAGADAVVVGHGLPGLALDPLTLRPSLGSGTGSLSGPAVHAVALRCLWEVHAALPEVALVGSGGVRSGLDALAMLAAGARAVQVGTTVLHDPGAPDRIVAELHDELDRRGIPSVADVVGHAHRPEGDPR
jgi:dihydroorotate dehydrogenase (NAD+) catalytic subunit